MRCPHCDKYVTIEDWTDDSPFECESCDTTIRLVVDEGTYRGATDQRLEIYEDDG